ncbi:MAG: threonine synthase [Chloroflexota bacterium]|nr:threonine synthase [Chloroflexota bacterium]
MQIEADKMRVFCVDCGKETDFNPLRWRCKCGGAWEPAKLPLFDPRKIKSKDFTLWRYGELLGLDIHSQILQVGVGWTPLIPIHLFGQNVHLKLEFLSPSGSFKDRGVNTMVNQLLHMGYRTFIEDSSGNAGASLAMHGARFGVKTMIFVPEHASTAKINQIGVYGATIKTIPGQRKATERAAQAAVSADKVYASHAYNPAYLAGQISAAYELWEQLGHSTPDWIICPVGQGGLFLGYWFGFKQLLQAKLIDHMPHLVAVQSKLTSPIHRAWIEGLDHIPEMISENSSLAEGTAISKPVREKRILQALRETNGRTFAIPEKEIVQAQKSLAHLGYFIEPTSALVVAGLKQLLPQISKEDIVVLPLTGSGLKSAPQKN